MEQQEIIEFLIRAKQATYAGKGQEDEPSRPMSHDLSYSEGPLIYIDTYLGTESFAGQEAIWVNGKPFWTMNYLGRVLAAGFSGDFLKEALYNVPEERPYRGPQEYVQGNLTYKCTVEGDFAWFQGCEAIYCDRGKVYECVFHGGKLRQR